MANFLEDFSGLNAAGGFLKGFSDQYGQAQDRKMKQMELESHLKAQDEARQRNKTLDQLTMQKAGYMQGDDGSLQEAPLTARQRGEQKFKAFGEGAKLTTDDSGNITDVTLDPNSMKAKESQSRTAMANAGLGLRQERIGIQRDNQTSQAVDKITNDDQIKSHQQRIQGATRILEQLGDIKSGKMVDTKQFLGDLNTEYVSLLTGSNNTALGKQERTEYGTKAADLAGIIQSITKDPTSINSPKILKQLETGVVSLRDTYQKNLGARADFLKRRYSSNPDAERQQQEKIDSLKSANGLLQPQGLLSQGQGLVAPGGGASALPAAAHPDTPEAVAWAKANQSDPRAVKILQRVGGQ